MHVEKQPIITIIINGFHYGFYFHDSKKQIWKIIKKWESVESREREREREIVNKNTVKVQSRASKYWNMLLTFLSQRNLSLCQMACTHLRHFDFYMLHLMIIAIYGGKN